MQKKTKINIKKGVANFFGSLGYISCTLEWLWIFLLYIKYIQKMLDHFIGTASNNTPTETPIPVATSSSPNVLMILLSVVIVAIVIAMSIYLLYKIPTSIVKTSKITVHNTAKNIAPIIINTQHNPQTKSFNIKLTFTLVLVIKIILILVPILLAFCYKFLDEKIVDSNIALASTIFFVITSLFMFSCQYTTAWALKVKKQDVW